MAAHNTFSTEYAKSNHWRYAGTTATGTILKMAERRGDRIVIYNILY
jgi:hypothetical protein